jgi:hypothetical protein
MERPDAAMRADVRTALVEHNAALIQASPFPSRIQDIIDVEEALRRFDRGEAILRHGS